MINIMFYFLIINQYLCIITCFTFKYLPVLVYYYMCLTLFPLTEKGNGEYQLSSGPGHEEWQVHTGLSLNHQESETGEG